MKFQTTTRPLRELVREFHTGAILLPQFQRDFVWRPARIGSLRRLTIGLESTEKWVGTGE